MLRLGRAADRECRAVGRARSSSAAPRSSEGLQRCTRWHADSSTISQFLFFFFYNFFFIKIFFLSTASSTFIRARDRLDPERRTNRVKDEDEKGL